MCAMRRGEGAGVVCFMLTPTTRAVRELRRHASNPGHSHGPHGYHSAEVDAGVVDAQVTRDGTVPAQAARRRRGDPPWPEACSCGYRFTKDDPKQVNLHLLFRRSDTGTLTTLRDAKPGAMWDARWIRVQDWRGPDGRSLVVRCPNGMDWHIDGTSSSGGRWTRTGSPPEVTVSPSIAIGHPDDPTFYHGHLQGGIFTGHVG
jgi:hypothetical protein